MVVNWNLWKLCVMETGMCSLKPKWGLVLMNDHVKSHILSSSTILFELGRNPRERKFEWSTGKEVIIFCASCSTITQYCSFWSGFSVYSTSEIVKLRETIRPDSDASSMCVRVNLCVCATCVRAYVLVPRILPERKLLIYHEKWKCVTHGPTYRPLYRDAMTHLKIVSNSVNESQ